MFHVFAFSLLAGLVGGAVASHLYYARVKAKVLHRLVELRQSVKKDKEKASSAVRKELDRFSKL